MKYSALKILLLLFVGFCFTINLGFSMESTEESLGLEERLELYEKNGFAVGKELYQSPNEEEKSAENKSLRSDRLNASIREKSILQNLELLSRTKDKKIRLKLLQRVSALYKVQAEVFSRRTDLHNKEKKMQELLEKANQLLLTQLKLYPKESSDSVLFSLAENHAKMNDSKSAEHYYRQVILHKNSPVLADAHLALGNLYYDKQQFQGARAQYEKIFSTPEEKLHPYAQYKIAWTYFNENSFPRAVQGLERSIELSRRLQDKTGEKKLGVEEEALSDMVLFFAEVGDPQQAKEQFEKIVSKEQAKEMRYQLARRLFEHGKHEYAKFTAKELLADNPNKEYTAKLYLVLISVADRTKDRGLGLASANELTQWMKKETKKDDAQHTETEEYLRLYSQKLHHEAETLKLKEIWEQARKSYEIYLSAFPEEEETAEVRFRYAVLLMNRKEPLKAYESVQKSLLAMGEKHSRHKDALKLRIQAIEHSSKEERKKIPEQEVLFAYDEFALHYPEDGLALEAEYKAASLAKELLPVQEVAKRYKKIIAKNPKHVLAKAALSDALAVLVKSEEWSSLRQESTELLSSEELKTQLFFDNTELKQKLLEASELAAVKIAENFEQKGLFTEALKEYEKIFEGDYSKKLRIHALVRSAKIEEDNLKNLGSAIKLYEKLGATFGADKEGLAAQLEIARLWEKTHKAEKAAKQYLLYAQNKSSPDNLRLSALKNAAILYESTAKRSQAAEVFSEAKKLAASIQAQKEITALQGSYCRNTLLAAAKELDEKYLNGIIECAQKSHQDKLAWAARAAWASEKLQLDASPFWEKVARSELKSPSKEEKAYIVAGKVRLLRKNLEKFKQIKFSRTNEKPETNIAKKVTAMEAIEKQVAVILENGFPKQILQANKILQEAYGDFSETMENAALPTKLSEQEKEILKQSFMSFAQEFRKKQEQLNVPMERKIASLPEQEKISLPTANEMEQKTLLEGGLGSPELYAKMASLQFTKGNWNEAHYFAVKWRNSLQSSPENAIYGVEKLQHLEDAISMKLEERDPLAEEF